MKHKELYDAITDFRIKYGSRKFNDDENMTAYRNLVDMSIKCGIIPECNRKEYSTHGRLMAPITYEGNRIAFCQWKNRFKTGGFIMKKFRQYIEMWLDGKQVRGIKNVPPSTIWECVDI